MTRQISRVSSRPPPQTGIPVMRANRLVLGTQGYNFYLQCLFFKLFLGSKFNSLLDNRIFHEIGLVKLGAYSGLVFSHLMKNIIIMPSCLKDIFSRFEVIALSFFLPSGAAVWKFAIRRIPIFF